MLIKTLNYLYNLIFSFEFWDKVTFFGINILEVLLFLLYRFIFIINIGFTISGFILLIWFLIFPFLLLKKVAKKEDIAFLLLGFLVTLFFSFIVNEVYEDMREANLHNLDNNFFIFWKQ